MASAALALAIGCGRRDPATQILQPIENGGATGEESAARGKGGLPDVWELDGLFADAKSVRNGSSVEIIGADYSEADTTSDREESIEVEGESLDLRAYEPDDFTYAIFTQEVGDGVTGGGRDDDIPLSSLFDTEPCDYGGGRDDDIPLNFYVGLADYSAGSWRWFGPYTEEDPTLEVYSDELNNRFKSPSDHYYAAVLTASPGKGASALPRTGLVAELPLDGGMRGASQTESPAGVRLNRLVTEVEAGHGTVPAQVRGLAAVVGASSITISWEANPDPDVTAYRVYRKSIPPDDSFTLLDEVAAPATECEDTTADIYSTYTYGVSAVNDTGEGSAGRIEVGPPRIRGVSPQSGAEGREVSFFVVADGSGPFAYEWYFGGGATPNTSTDSRPTVHLEAMGQYPASVTVFNAYGQDTLDFTLSVLDPYPSGWWMFHRDPTHRGRSEVMGPGDPLLKWRYQTGGKVQSSPVIGRYGTIYAGSEDGYLYALNPDGSLKWKCNTGGSIYAAPAVGSDETIYIGNWDSTFYAIHPNGVVKWSYPTGSWMPSSAAIARDGTICVGSDDNFLYAFNPDGSLKWSYDAGWHLKSSPAIADDGTIYVGCWDNFLYALNPDGSLKWRYETEGYIISSPAIGYDGVIYVGNGSHLADNHFQAINPDGSMRWELDIYGYVDSSPAIGANGMIYAGARDYKLYAITPEGGIDWSYNTGSPVNSSPVVGADGTIYFGATGQMPDAYYFYALTTEGELLWRYPVGGSIESSPALGADGTLYFGCDDGYIYALHD
jgi:outer membrane protein assembly factor BamB